MLGLFNSESSSLDSARVSDCRTVRPAVTESLEARLVFSTTTGADGAPELVAQAEATTIELGGNLQFQSEGTRDHALANLVKAVSGFKNLSGGAATTDAAGHPTQDFVAPVWQGLPLDPGQYKISFTGPSNTVVSLAKGAGTLQKVGTSGSVNNWTLDVPTTNLTELHLKFTGTAGQVKNLAVMQPGTNVGDVWSPKYVNLLKTANPATLRMMEIAKINHNSTADWSQRPKSTDANYNRAGVPWEELIELTNEIGSNIWVPVPVRATDDYIRQLATLLKNNLNPGAKIYLEYSNEVWNSIYDQGKYNLAQAEAEVAANPGSNLKYDGTSDKYKWADRRNARRLKQITDIFKNVWTTAGQSDPINGRVRAVLGGQATRPQKFDDMLAFLNSQYGAPSNYLYGIGGAWYFQLNKYSDQYINGQNNLTKEQVLEGMDLSVSAYENERRFVSHATRAANWGLKLEAYEIGVDTMGSLNVQAKAEASRDPRMKGLMERFVRAFKDQGGDVAQWYTLGARSFVTNSGTWTVTENVSSLNTPKIQAFRALRGTGSTPPPTPTQSLVVSTSSLTVAEGASTPFTVKLAVQPAPSDAIVVNIARTSGDADLSNATTALTFTSENWNVAQSVSIAAAEDADTANGTASFTVSSSGLASKTVSAAESDNDTPPPPPPPAGQVTLRANADTYVRDGTHAGTNFGTAGQLQAKKGSTSYNRETFLRFDLSSVAGIESAKLRLFGALDNTLAASAGFTLYNSTNTSWSETAVTWNAKPAAGTTVLGAGTVTGITPKAYEVDLTNFLKSQKAAGATAVTLVLKATAASNATILFDSDEGANPPQLIITPDNTPPQQGIVTSESGIVVPEGASASFSVKLAVQPASDIIVNVARTAGDTDLSTATTALTFTSGNWNVAQVVSVAGAEDADTTNGSATFTISSTGLTSKTVAATEADNDAPPAGPVIVRANADTYVRNGTYAGTNFGTAGDLQVKTGSTSFTRESYLRFDLSKVTINNAKLRLFGRLDNTAAASAGFTIYNASNTTWSETGVTHNTKLTSGTAVRGNGTVTGTTGKWYEIDLTTFLKAEKAAGRSTVTLVIKATAASNATILFDSDEGANRPELLVN